MYCSAPSILERVVPDFSNSPPKAYTASDDLGTFELMGYSIPPGTIVGTQAWSMHRNARIFPSPETFLPERWIAREDSEGEMERLREMDRNMMPFGTVSAQFGLSFL
jgi:cytochrome P450